MMELLEAAMSYADTLKAIDCKPFVVQFEIDGIMYTSTKLPTTPGFIAHGKLVALLGSTVTAMVITGQKFDAALVFRALAQVDFEELLPLLKDLLVKTECGRLRSTGKSGSVLSDFEHHFAGEYPHLLKVAAFAAGHTLRGFTYGAH